MLNETAGSILLGADHQGAGVHLPLKMCNRHGLVAGATGTGKTVTVQIMAEAFSRAGV
ncbi:MAG: helicase HerA-like domain-containing protein, partial [Pseudomonadota bacterium]